MTLHKILRSGRLVDLDDFRPHRDFDWLDVAAGLSVPRFGGQTHTHYYVTEHCVLLHDYFIDVHNNDVRAAKHALLHDVAEAYLGDVQGALKRRLPQYVALEQQLTRKILEHLGVAQCPRVGAADKMYVNNELAFFWPEQQWGEPLRGAKDPTPLDRWATQQVFLERVRRYF